MEKMRIEENTLAPSYANPEKKNKNKDKEDRTEYTCITPIQTTEEEEDDEEQIKVQRWCVSAVKVSVEKSWWRRKEGAAMMFECHSSIHGEEDDEEDDQPVYHPC